MCKIQSDQDRIQQQYILQRDQISLQVRISNLLSNSELNGNVTKFIFCKLFCLCYMYYNVINETYLWFDSGRVAKEVIEASSKIQREPPMVHRSELHLLHPKVTKS